MIKSSSSSGGGVIGGLSLGRCTWVSFALLVGAVVASLWTGLIVLRVEVMVNPAGDPAAQRAAQQQRAIQQHQHGGSGGGGHNQPAPLLSLAGAGADGDAAPVAPTPSSKDKDKAVRTGAAAGGTNTVKLNQAPAALGDDKDKDGGAKKDADDDDHATGRKCWRKNARQAEPPSAQVAANPKCNAGDRARWRPGKCSFDASWLEPWTRFRPGGNWTIVDVGANKGYVIAGWLDVLQHKSQFSPHHLGMLLFNRTMSGASASDGGWTPSHCGGCCECLDRPPNMPRANKAHSVKVYGFEPSINNYRWLSSFFTDRATITIRNAAASDAPGRAYFPDQAFGIETGKVVSEPQAGYLPVDIVALDDELGHIPFLDILSTDAEGFDQQVAKGAEKFLKEGRVGVYQFEMYKSHDYKEIFERLGRWGYACYFSTASRRDRCHKPPKKPMFKVPMIVRITDCWEDDYNGYVGWVNGLCHNTRIEPLNKIFEYLANKRHKGGNGNCAPRASGRSYTRRFVEEFVVPLREGVLKERPEARGVAVSDDLGFEAREPLTHAPDAAS